MKASAFSYARATSVANALELLAAHGDRAKVLSGGQSLMPAMNLRLISPELIVDIGELDGVARHRGQRTISSRIGALTRHVDLQRFAGDRRARAAADGSRRPCRSSRDPQQGNPWRQPCACRPRLRTAGLHGCAECDALSCAARRASGELRLWISSRESMRRSLSPQELLIAVELPVRRKRLHAFFPRICPAARRLRHRRPGGAGDRGRRVITDLRLAFFAVGDRPVLAKARMA